MVPVTVAVVTMKTMMTTVSQRVSSVMTQERSDMVASMVASVFTRYWGGRCQGG